MFIKDNINLAFHAIYVMYVPYNAQKRLKLAIFRILMDVWAQTTILRIRKVRDMCKCDVWALDEAF